MKLRIALSLIILLLLIPATSGIMDDEYRTFVPFVQSSRPVEDRGAGATYAANGEYERCRVMSELGLGWYFNWGADPGICPGVDSVPLIWCDNIPSQLGGCSLWAGFGNEADIPSQCGKTPTYMASVWANVLSQHPGRKWVAPNTYSIEWADEWLSIISRKPDALGIHCSEIRGGEGYCEGHWQRAIDLAKKYNIPEVWITEYAYVQMSEEPISNAIPVMRRWLDYVDSQSMITRHAWFQLSYSGSEPWAWGIDRNTSLVDFYSGELTILGEAYRISQPAPTPTPPIIYADPRADVDSNFTIDIRDIVIVGGSFGRPVRR